ncbi:MAG: SDR family oxidoreductase [Chitinophagales bacterium]|nr:SDR family oxidoreductase [Chitinophagales bacterium]
MATLQNKVIWLTGASSGIGEALAYELARRGAKLILSARREDELNRVAENIINVMGFNEQDVHVLPLDLADTGSLAHKTDEAILQFGHVDILINNGGISQRSLVKDTPVEVDRKLFEVNFFGTVALTKALLPHFLETKQGTFVTITSAVGKFGSPWRSGYSASKHALHGFFDSLRAEVHEQNIKVLLVCPGFIQTNVSINALTASGEKLGTMDAATAQGLTAESCAHQIANAIEKQKEEVLIGGVKEKFGAFMKRFFPSIFAIMLRKMAVR